MGFLLNVALIFACLLNSFIFPVPQSTNYQEIRERHIIQQLIGRKQMANMDHNMTKFLTEMFQGLCLHRALKLQPAAKENYRKSQVNMHRFRKYRHVKVKARKSQIQESTIHTAWTFLLFHFFLFKLSRSDDVNHMCLAGLTLFPIWPSVIRSCLKNGVFSAILNITPISYFSSVFHISLQFIW